MATAGGHTLEDRERDALRLLASSMFAEAQELPSDSDLAACLGGYVAQLLQPPTKPRGERRRESYVISSLSDAPVFRRLATHMDALSLSLGQWSGVGRALSRWAARINLAVAEAELRHSKLYGPSSELLAMAAALGVEGDARVHEWLVASQPAPSAQSTDGEPGLRGPERVRRTGRVWSRGDEELGRSGRRRR